MFIGFSILLIGTILLLKNLDIIPGDAWDIIWPSIIIIFGLSLILKPFRICRWGGFKKYFGFDDNND